MQAQANYPLPGDIPYKPTIILLRACISSATNPAHQKCKLNLLLGTVLAPRWSAYPRVLVIVMLPLPPSVWIFLLWTTGFPEIADASCEFGPSSLLCFTLNGGGVWIFLFLSFSVTAPWKLHGLMSSKGKATDVLCLFALIILLPAVKQRNYISPYAV
jgi:hypothetical protein